MRRLDSSSVTSRSGSAAASGIPGAPPPEPTSTIEPPKPRDRLERGEAVIEVHAPRLGRIAHRGQPGRGDERVEPALEPWIGQAGSITTKRLGSVPSLRVVTPG